MDDLIDMMASNASASEVSDRIKEILMQKSAANIDAVRPMVAQSMFGQPTEGEEEVEVDEPTAELETETETEEESEEEETD